MSTDKPAGRGENRPDRVSRPENRPFPGQPDNRPPVPPPAGVKTPGELRADRAKYKTTSEYNTAKAAEKAERTAASQPAAGPGGNVPAKDIPAQATATPRTRGRTGGTPDDAPARGDGGARHPGDAHDRGPGPGAAALAGDRRPQRLQGQDRIRHRPFPGQPDNRPPVPPPAGVKTPDELRADRARYKTTSEYNTAKAADKTAAQQAAAKEPLAGKESAAARPGSRTTAERGRGTHDRGRTGTDQTEHTSAQVREASTRAGKTNETQAAKREPGGDKRPDPLGHPGKTSPALRDTPQAQAPDGPHPPGNESPPHNRDSFAARAGDKSGILHGHSEFHGQKLDLYTDGTRWVGGDAVQAAKAEAARPRADGQYEPQRHDITDIPQMRDLGRNTVGDVSDDPPIGDQLLEPDDKGLPRPERLRRAIDRDFDDFSDAVSNTAVAVQEIVDLPPSGAGQAACLAVPPSGPEILPMPYQSPDVGSIAQLGVVLGVVGWHAYSKTRDMVSEMSDKVSEWRRNQDAGNG